MPTTPAPAKNLPLPAQIFHAAMEQQRSLADYARSLDIDPASLQAVVLAQLERVEPAAFGRLAEIYHESRETLSAQLSVNLPAEPFADWLKRNMEGMPQRGVRARAQLDAQTFKRFLNGETLPDSDEAKRLSRALYIDAREVARVVTANMILQARAEQPAEAASLSVEQTLPATATARPRRRRGQAETLDIEPAAGEAAITTADKTAVSPVESSQSSVSGPPAVTADIVKPAPSEYSPEPALVASRKQSRKRAPARQPGAANAAIENIAISSAEAVAYNPPAATGDETAPDFTTPRPPGARKQRQPKPVTEQAATDANLPAIDPAGEEASAREHAPRRNRAPESRAAQPAGPATAAQVAAGRAPAAEASSPAPASPDRIPEPAATSAATAVPATPELIPAVSAADTTLLQLTADEVRLIRHWRQLHPHGRRATLHYIGSLLVEE